MMVVAVFGGSCSYFAETGSTKLLRSCSYVFRKGKAFLCLEQMVLNLFLIICSVLLFPRVFAILDHFLPKQRRRVTIFFYSSQVHSPLN
jgi:hypothetical protein